MDPHPLQPPHGTTVLADLDRTDELPVLDPGAYEARERAAANAPTAAGDAAVPAREPDDPLQTAAANLRQAQDLLGSRAERLRTLEISLQAAHAARAAAEQRAAALAEELTHTRVAGEERAAQLGEELTRARVAGEERAAQL
ncbi:MAG: hypothetical protein WBE65_17240, partial [Steroidobacteraceae bacterium]